MKSIATIFNDRGEDFRAFIPGRRWPLAFAFGLVHGPGFATALGPLSLPPVALGIALLSFNLGLKAAQMSFAAVVLPIGFALRNTALYPRRIMPGISRVASDAGPVWQSSPSLLQTRHGGDQDS